MQAVRGLVIGTIERVSGGEVEGEGREIEIESERGERSREEREKHFHSPLRYYLQGLLATIVRLATEKIIFKTFISGLLAFVFWFFQSDF